jgi:mannose-6-phosphate isomerase-like protein (cupin superfamily)
MHAPGTSEVFHFHSKAQQFFFILSGQATMEINGERLLFKVGQGVAIPPGTRHQFRNLSGEPVRFLVNSQPPSHGDGIIVKPINSGYHVARRAVMNSSDCTTASGLQLRQGLRL